MPGPFHARYTSLPDPPSRSYGQPGEAVVLVGDENDQALSVDFDTLRLDPCHVDIYTVPLGEIESEGLVPATLAWCAHDIIPWFGYPNAQLCAELSHSACTRNRSPFDTVRFPPSAL
jgi:hypothetical protein